MPTSTAKETYYIKIKIWISNKTAEKALKIYEVKINYQTYNADKVQSNKQEAKP